MSNRLLVELREEIDRLDSELLDVMVRRFECCREIGLEKMRLGLPVKVPGREEHVVGGMEKLGVDLGIDAEFVKKIYTMILEYSVNLQTVLRDNDAEL